MKGNYLLVKKKTFIELFQNEWRRYIEVQPREKSWEPARRGSSNII